MNWPPIEWRVTFSLYSFMWCYIDVHVLLVYCRNLVHLFFCSGFVYGRIPHPSLVLFNHCFWTLCRRCMRVTFSLCSSCDTILMYMYRWCIAEILSISSFVQVLYMWEGFLIIHLYFWILINEYFVSDFFFFCLVYLFLFVGLFFFGWTLTHAFQQFIC